MRVRGIDIKYTHTDIENIINGNDKRFKGYFVQKKNHKKYFEPPETYFDKKWGCVGEFYNSREWGHCYEVCVIDTLCLGWLLHFCTFLYNRRRKRQERRILICIKITASNRVFILLHKIFSICIIRVSLLKNIKNVLQFSQLSSNSQLIIFLPVYPSSYMSISPLKKFPFLWLMISHAAQS